MAHTEQRNFCLLVKEKYPEYFKNKKVLDIGSLDINGSNKDLFENCNYLGIDVGEGRNVDLVSIGHLFDGPNEHFDTIISTEVFEHDMFYEETVKNITRMLKPGGLFLFTCAAPGRPEHGTRRCGEQCAPLLLQVSEQWADYYKNLLPEDFKRIPNFNENFPDCYFEVKDTDIEIPSDLYFCGIKGGEKFLNDVEPKFPITQYPDDIFVIDCWPNTPSKENDLVNLIRRLRIYNVPILLTGHYPIREEIQKMVDYYIFDRKNPLLTKDEFGQYNLSSGRWTAMGDYRIDNENLFHHDYAIWEAMRSSFNFCKFLGKKNIHFFEYDNLPDEVQYRQAFLERINQFDAVLYEYSENSTTNTNFSEYCATFIFSIKTDVAIKVIDQVKSKHEYFFDRPNGWQLERIFLKCLRNVTNNIHISDYVANNNELNTQAVWNRDGVFRNGAVFQTYIAADKKGKLYIHFISGFSETPADKDYLVEVNYRDYKKFYNITKGSYHTECLGKYRKGERVKVYYQGVEVYNEFLGDDVSYFRTIHKLTWNNEEKNDTVVNVNFIDGPFVEIIENDENRYSVEFINLKNNFVEYRTILKSNHWAKCGIQYQVDWLIKVTGIDNNFTFEHKFNPENRRVLIGYESKSLGDNIAWIPYVDKFQKTHNCEVYCSTFHNDLFKDQYPNIKFVDPGKPVNDLYVLFRIGMFYKTNEDGTREISKVSHPSDPKKEPLTKMASDILGLDYVEIKPKLKKYGKKKQKRVCIGVHTTAQSKYWNNPTGWQDVVDFLNDNGYEVRLMSKEEDGYMGNKNPTGIVNQPAGPLTDVMKVIQESELFIGISSGLSWLAWGVETPTILISGFTDKFTEPIDGVTRIINKNVCNSCWSDYDFDPGDWNWCPVMKGTDRQFECSKEISSESVISEIKKLLKL